MSDFFKSETVNPEDGLVPISEILSSGCGRNPDLVCLAKYFRGNFKSAEIPLAVLEIDQM